VGAAQHNPTCYLVLLFVLSPSINSGQACRRANHGSTGSPRTANRPVVYLGWWVPFHFTHPTMLDSDVCRDQCPVLPQLVEGERGHASTGSAWTELRTICTDICETIR